MHRPDKDVTWLIPAVTFAVPMRCCGNCRRALFAQLIWAESQHQYPSQRVAFLAVLSARKSSFLRFRDVELDG